MVSGNSQVRRILIVDDSPEAVEVLLRALPSSYRRQVALNGKRALELLCGSEQLPDLILLDVVMPDLDGYEVCRQLKSDERLRSIPVIFLSSLSDKIDKVKAFQNGGVDYIEKPFAVEEVQARIETHLRLYHLQLQLEQYNRHLSRLVEEKVREISDAQLATIFALVKLAEAKDDETGVHIERVAQYCQTLCEMLRRTQSYESLISDSYLENIFLASPLHDIGKVGIPDNILTKPGKLSPAEYEIMKKHTTIGAETLLAVKERYPSNEFIGIGSEIALSHHEKWDGTGYPLGLKGEDIPLGGRIMALADVYDALRSRRVYKEPYSHEHSMEIIEQSLGRHFDPEIGRIFTENAKVFANIFATTAGQA